MLRVRRRKTMKTRKTLDSTCNLPPEAFPKTPPKKKIHRKFSGNSWETPRISPENPQRIPRKFPQEIPRKFLGNSQEIRRSPPEIPRPPPGHSQEIRRSPREIPRKFADTVEKFPGNPPGKFTGNSPGKFCWEIPRKFPPRGDPRKFPREILPGTPRKFLGNSPSSRPKTKEEPKNASSSGPKSWETRRNWILHFFFLRGSPKKKEKKKDIQISFQKSGHLSSNKT